MRILIDLGRLRASSTKLYQTAECLLTMDNRLNSVLGSLDWEVRRKVGMEVFIVQARNQARALAAQAEKMARYLASKAQAFEEADRQGANAVGQINITFSQLLQDTRSWWGFPGKQAADIVNLGSLLGQPTNITLLHLPIVGGSATVAGLTAEGFSGTAVHVEYDSWDAVLNSEKSLSRQIEDLQKQLQIILQRERSLIERRYQLGMELHRWQNKVLPADWPPRAGSDDKGLDVPWRTKSDVLEDEIADIDAQLRQIQEEYDETRQEWEQVRQEHEKVQKLVEDKVGWVWKVKPQCQGDRYGSAACLPTSASMIMDYYNVLDNKHQTASPDALIRGLESGDGTPGKGISGDKMEDDLKELGYKATWDMDASVEKLKSELTNGPVIISAWVTLGKDPREISVPGETLHAMVVRGFSADGETVVINDPWTGAERTFSKSQVEEMLAGDGAYMYVIRPS